MMQHYLWFFLSGFLILTACQKDDSIRIGTLSGPETTLIETAQSILKNKYQLNIKIIEFSDYNLPNTALNDGSIDANLFQHLPYLEAEKKARGYAIVSIAKTFIYPMGLYSKKIKHLAELRQKDLIAIPNDPTNEARALLLLQTAKLIKLRKNNRITLTPSDIIDNPKQLQFVVLDAAQLPRSLEDTTLAAINTNYAVPANLLPKRDAIFMENNDSPYANILVVKKEQAKDPKWQKIIAALQSKAVLAKAKELFNDQAIAAW